jgi:hypothetical protein
MDRYCIAKIRGNVPSGWERDDSLPILIGFILARVAACESHVQKLTPLFHSETWIGVWQSLLPIVEKTVSRFFDATTLYLIVCTSLTVIYLPSRFSGMGCAT